VGPIQGKTEGRGRAAVLGNGFLSLLGARIRPTGVTMDDLVRRSVRTAAAAVAFEEVLFGSILS
jgi:hypothetical protein